MIAIFRAEELRDRLENESHGMDISDWAQLLIDLWPEDYRDPPPAPTATVTLPGTDERIAVMEERAAMGVQIFHPHDIRDASRLGHRGQRLDNGQKVRISSGKLELRLFTGEVIGG